MKNLKKLLSLLALILLLFNCSSSSTDDLSPIPDPDPDPVAKLTYVDDIKPIIDGNCISCHGNPPTQGAPSSFTTFALVKNSVNSILTRINNSGGAVMPPSGPMSQSLRDQIQQWKDDGLLEN